MPVSRRPRIERRHRLSIGDGLRIGIGIAFWLFVAAVVFWFCLASFGLDLLILGTALAIAITLAAMAFIGMVSR